MVVEAKREEELFFSSSGLSRRMSFKGMHSVASP